MRAISRLCLILVLAGCGDDDPTQPGGTGTVEVTTVSTGEGLDTDGYIVEVVGSRTLAVGTNATVALTEVPAGDSEVRLTGVRGNCTVEAPHPRLVRVTAGDTIRTQFDVACANTPLLGRIVFYSNRDGNYDLYSMLPDGSDPVQLTHLPEGERAFYPAVSPDGSQVLFINRIGPEDDFNSPFLYVMNADGTNLVQLPPANSSSLGPPVWSPDGSQIAFDGWLDDNGFDIWVMDADGTGLRNLTETPDIGEGYPSWSPDGQRILFTSSTEDQLRLEIMNSDGTGRGPVGGDNAYRASWSPDGTRIAFLSFQDERDRLFLMLADGSNAQPLTADDGGSDDAPSWSPAGDRLAFIHSGASDIEVHVINADGTGNLNISNNDTFEFLGRQAWGP